MRCDFIQIKDRVYQCRRCGKTIGAAPGIEPRWDKIPDCKGPTASQKLFNYAAAVVRWLEAKMPLRPDHEIARILEMCTQCAHYENNTCKLCGCRLAGRNALFAKVRMATEHCPIGRW